MDVAGFVHYGNAMVRVYSTALSDGDVGKTVTLVSKLHNKTYSKVFTSTQDLVFEVDERDKYTITLTNTSNVVEFTTTIQVGFGTYTEIEVGMNKTTWQGIQNICNAGLEASMLTIGDAIDVTLSTAEVVTMELAAMNVDDGVTHQTIWCPADCLTATRNMNSTNTNAGGWACEMRTWLENTYYSELPTDLQAVITARKIKSSTGSQSSALQETSDKIFLPREHEIFGATTYAAGSEAPYASQWSIFATAAKRVKKLGKNGSAANWWELSPYVSTSGSFCCVDSGGTAGNGYASAAYGVVPCFQIIKTA